MRFEKSSEFSTMLVEQYRMHHLIMQWSSDAMYESCLVAHASVAHHTAIDLSENCELPPLMFVDTAGTLMHESVDENA